MEETVAAWVRKEAARQDISISQLLDEILKERMREEEDSYENAMHRALARKPFLKTDGLYPSRDEIYDRFRFRGGNS